MLAAATLDAADGYWAAFLGVPRGQLRPAAPLVVPHAVGLAGYRGMYAQSFGGAAPVVSLPAELLARFGDDAAGAAAGGLVDDGRWRRVFGGRMDAVVGPAAIAYADAGTLRPSATNADLRPLADADRSALDALRRAVTDEEWAHGGSTMQDGPVVGAFVDGALAAVAGYEVWGGRIAHLGIVSHPAHRGRGLGTAAVAGAARTALDAGLAAQYRTLASNTPSLRIARRLGFLPYATSLAVRLSDA